MKKAVIIGAGPAGLTAAYMLLKKTDIRPCILEETSAIGGFQEPQSTKETGWIWEDTGSFPRMAKLLIYGRS